MSIKEGNLQDFQPRSHPVSLHSRVCVLGAADLADADIRMLSPVPYVTRHPTASQRISYKLSNGVCSHRSTVV